MAPASSFLALNNLNTAKTIQINTIEMTDIRIPIGKNKGLALKR